MQFTGKASNAGGRTKGRGGHQRRRRGGAAAVELALIAPFFFLLVFGMIEYGRMIMVQQVLTNASREGARAAVLDGATIDSVKDVVEAYAENGSLTVDREFITVSPDPATASFGQPITITISVPYSDVSWLPGALYLNGSEIVSSTVMRKEGLQ